MKKASLPLFVGILMVAASARAAEGGKALVATDAAAFQTQSAVIKRELSDGKTYGELADKERAEVLSALGRIAAALGTAASVESMPEEAKVRVFNDQELVNAILTKGREDSRLVCAHETPVGSHRPVTRCQTVAERRRIQERTQDALQKDFHGQALKSD